MTRGYLSGRRSRGRDYHISRCTRHELQAHHLGHVALLNRPRAGPALVCDCVNVNVCLCVISDTCAPHTHKDAIRGSTITSSTLLTAIQYRCGAFLTAQCLTHLPTA